MKSVDQLCFPIGVVILMGNEFYEFEELVGIEQGVGFWVGR